MEENTFNEGGGHARTIAPEASQEIIGIRPGEKLHEEMVSKEDAYFT